VRLRSEARDQFSRCCLRLGFLISTRPRCSRMADVRCDSQSPSATYAVLVAGADDDNEAGAAMRRFRWVRGVVVLELAGTLVGAVASGGSAVPARGRCRPTAFVANNGSTTVSTIDVKTGTKNPADIVVGPLSAGVAVAPDGKTASVTTQGGTLSTIDVKTSTKDPADITVGADSAGVAVTPDGKTAFAANLASGTVSAVDVKTRTKRADDIPVGSGPLGLAITPDGETGFVTTTSPTRCRRLT
jgi:YVTN family beta-propeller protein